MKPQIKDNIKQNNVKVNSELTKKYKDKIVFKEKFDRVSSHFEGRDLVKEVEILLSN
jgi:hypothetical protein